MRFYYLITWIKKQGLVEKQGLGETEHPGMTVKWKPGIDHAKHLYIFVGYAMPNANCNWMYITTCKYTCSCTWYCSIGHVVAIDHHGY